jgi:hypothetical protein
MKSLGKPRHRCGHNIKMDIKEIVFEDVDWINQAQDRYQWRITFDTIMMLRVP